MLLPKCVCFLKNLDFSFIIINKTLYTGKEYAAADYRWGISDPTVVALEILTVFGAGPLCCYILKQLANDDPARHYWLIVLSTAELYGGYDDFFFSRVL